MVKSKKNECAIDLTMSARDVFRQLALAGPASRPQIASRLNLSRPTLSQAIEDLEALDYVESFGSTSSSAGRKAVMYRVAPGAGHLIAVDAGSTFVRIRVQSVSDSTLFSGIYGLPKKQRRLTAEIADTVELAVREAQEAALDNWGPLRCLAIALPTMVSDRDAKQQDRTDAVMHRLEKIVDAPVLFENNVNCAAIAEEAQSPAHSPAPFVYIQIGVKIGLGIVIAGNLLRGASGAAGEISYLPFPWAPNTPSKREELEAFLGAEALMERLQEIWPEGEESPNSTQDLFALARDGHEQASNFVSDYAREVGKLVAASIAVLDPVRVVLGGGVGQNELLLPGIKQEIERLNGPTPVAVTALGKDATLLGITRIARTNCLAFLVGEVAL